MHLKTGVVDDMPVTQRASLGRAPGPSGVAVAGALPGFVRDPFRYLQACARRYGDIYRLPLGMADFTVVNHPNYVGHFLTEHPDNYPKGEMNRRMLPAMGDGLPISVGEHWRRNRRVMNPMFGKRALDGIFSIVANSVAESIERLDRYADRGEVIDFEAELGMLTMQVLQRAMFSSSVSDEEIPHLVDAIRRMSLYAGSLMATVWAPKWMPVPYQRTGAPAREKIRQVINGVIAHRRANPVEDRDILNLLLEARYEDDGSPLVDEDIRDELFGMFFGGFDTTAGSLAWTFALLAANPDHGEALRAEADEFGDRFESAESLSALRYAKAAFQEAMRIQGPILLLTRQAVNEDEIGGYRIPAGSLVGVSPYTLHRNSEFWPDPERYDPGRFIGERLAGQAHHQFLPFGAGGRHCIGSNLAYMEAQLSLAMVAQRFHVQPVPGYVPEQHFHVSVGVKGGLPCTIRRRRV